MIYRYYRCLKRNALQLSTYRNRKINLFIGILSFPDYSTTGWLPIRNRIICFLSVLFIKSQKQMPIRIEQTRFLWVFGVLRRSETTCSTYKKRQLRNLIGFSAEIHRLPSNKRAVSKWRQPLKYISIVTYRLSLCDRVPLPR